MACTADSVFAALAEKPSAVKDLALKAAQYLDNITRLDLCSECKENTERKCDPVEKPEDITASHLTGLSCWGLPPHPNVPARIDIYAHFDYWDVNNIFVKDDDTGVELTVAMVVYGFDFRKKIPDMVEYELIYENKDELNVQRGKDNYFGWVDRAPRLVIELANKIRILDLGLGDVLSRIRTTVVNNNIHGLYASELKEYGGHLCDHIYHPSIEHDKDDHNVEVSFYEIYFMGRNLHEYDRSIDKIIEDFAHYNPKNRRQFLFNTPVSQVIDFYEFDLSTY